MPTRAPDTDQAWRLANEAVSTESHSRLEDWLIHWLMAFLYEWHDEDFSRSVAEARMAMQLAPYDPCSSSELSSVLANAGYEDEAVAGPRATLEHDPNGPSEYHSNLAWAYYIAGRDQESLDALRSRAAKFPVLYAAVLVRLGRVESAKAIVADYLKLGGGDTVEREDMIPLLEAAETDYLEALRKAGLPLRQSGASLARSRLARVVQSAHGLTSRSVAAPVRSKQQLALIPFGFIEGSFRSIRVGLRCLSIRPEPWGWARRGAFCATTPCSRSGRTRVAKCQDLLARQRYACSGEVYSALAKE